MIKDIIEIGKSSYLNKLTRQEIESVVTDVFELQDLYGIDLNENRDDIITLIEILTVKITILKRNEMRLKERCEALEKK